MRRAPALLTLALGISACANGSVLSEGGEAVADGPRSSAVLFVERQAAEPTGTPAHIGARFVQYTGLSAASLPDLLGTPRVPGAVTGCAERADTVVDTETARAQARLLDVGAIDVRSGERSVRLEPRRFPDLWNVVSGVIYATDDDMAADEWQFTAPGNAQTRLGGFDVTVRAPEELSGVTLAEQALTSGGSVTVPRRTAFQVRWTRGEAADGVVLTVDSAAGADRPTTIECTARDEGVLDVDAAWADRIAEVARTNGAMVTLHRVRTRPFTLQQVDSAQVVFDFSVRGHLQAE